MSTNRIERKRSSYTQNVRLGNNNSNNEIANFTPLSVLSIRLAILTLDISLSNANAAFNRIE